MAFAAFLPLIGAIVDKVIPDPEKAAEAKLKAMELAQRGELAQLDSDVRLALGQMEINKVEAASADFFRGGWWPAVGWTCVAGLAYTYVARPLLPWFVALFDAAVPPLPPIDTQELMILLAGLLGLGGMRTVERLRGRA